MNNHQTIDPRRIQQMMNSLSRRLVRPQRIRARKKAFARAIRRVMLAGEPAHQGGSMSEVEFDGQLTTRLQHERIVVLGGEVNDTIANRISGQLLLLSAEAAPRRGSRPDAAFHGQPPPRLQHERIVVLGGEVTDTIANRISGQLLLLSAEDSHRDISLYINSPGGSVTAGMSIYDTMQFIPNDVVTVATGLAASMGQFLLSSGTAGKRFATPHARILMHQPSGGIGGQESDVRIQAELIKHMKQVMAELTAEHTGQTVETILTDNARDKWFTAEDGLEYGFFDKIARRQATVSGGAA